ncbi:MAG: MBL fold metallo-hydrolase [Cryomorphaceae bacterium]|nr:MBL fold metallo-hydrolase [Flavobacteriales bacterium]
MKFTFLGTGTSQGVPVIGCSCEVCKSENPKDNRLRTSGMLEINGQTMVFDTGPDFRQQMLRAKPDNVDAVLFTHEHKDHLAGMDDIRPFNFKNKKPLDVFAHERVQVALKREFHYVFASDKYPGVPQVNLFDIHTDQPFLVGDTKVEPIEVFHYKMPVLGFRIRNFAYVTDAKTIAPEQLEKLKGLDVLVLNALRKKEHISHFNLEQAVELVHQLKPKRAFFTHISHFMGKHEDVSKELPKNIALAHDGLSIEVN